MNLYNLTDTQCRAMFMAISIDRLEVCDGDNHRRLTIDDVENFET